MISGFCVWPVSGFFLTAVSHIAPQYLGAQHRRYYSRNIYYVERALNGLKHCFKR